MNKEINVIVDDYIKVILCIPETITALELQGLMLKASKIANLSEMRVVKTTRKYGKKEEIVKKKKRGSNYNIWKPNMVEVLKFAMKNKEDNDDKKEIYEDVAEKVGLTPKQVQSKWNNMNTRGY